MVLAGKSIPASTVSWNEGRFSVFSGGSTSQYFIISSKSWHWMKCGTDKRWIYFKVQVRKQQKMRSFIINASMKLPRDTWGWWNYLIAIEIASHLIHGWHSNGISDCLSILSVLDSFSLSGANQCFWFDPMSQARQSISLALAQRTIGKWFS